MVITKYSLHILRYLYHQRSSSYFNLSKKFKGPELQETLDALIRNGYVVQIGGFINEYGEPIPILDDTLLKLSDLGIAEVESKQWFNLQFVLLQIVLPIAIAIITTLITIYLTALLSPSL